VRAKTRRNMDKLQFWCKRFRTSMPKIKKVQKRFITNGYKRPYLFNGYCPTEDCILYQKQFTDEFIVHELLHREFPVLTEKEVRKLTKIIVEEL
jgi:hypothetical protein